MVGYDSIMSNRREAIGSRTVLIAEMNVEVRQRVWRSIPEAANGFVNIDWSPNGYFYLRADSSTHYTVRSPRCRPPRFTITGLSNGIN